MKFAANPCNPRPSIEDIAKFVKEARAELQWKQLALADEAGVTPKTIERVESGKERVSEDTLTKIAKAFKLPERFFLDPKFWPSDEELVLRAQEMRKTFTTAELHPLAKAQDLENILASMARIIDDSAVDETLAEELASLKDEFQDWGDLYSDLPHTSRLECCRNLITAIRRIESHGYTAKWGSYISDEKLSVGVLVFQNTVGIPSEQQIRIAVVPRLLFPRSV